MPKIEVGKYRGTPIDQLPNGYLRWMLTQNFPKQWKEIAKRKVNSSDFCDTDIDVSRHAIDMFSKRFLHKWKDRSMGLATYVTKQAEKALNEGECVTKIRHKDDGISRKLDGVTYVFTDAEDFPEYRRVITVM